MIDPLSRLATLYGTDKFGYHDYTPNYFALLADRRDLPVKMLEIGVGGYGDEDRGGESLEVWREFFPQGQITGIDIQRKRLDLGPRVQILQGSQVDEQFLSGLVESRGPFDIILDDGSHRNDHIIQTFGILFPTLVPGGIYIAEDVQTSFHPRHGGSLELTQPNSVGFFAGLLDQMAQGAAGDITAIERFHNIVALHKAGDATPAAAAHRLIDATDRPAARVVVEGDAATDLPGIEVKETDGQPADLLVVPADAITDWQSVMDRIDRCAADATILIRGWPQDRALIRRLFAEIDHVEMRAHFRGAEILPTAPRILSLAAYGDGLVLQLGDNTYPSNFAYDADHPRVAATLKAMADLLATPEARPKGLLLFADLVSRYRSPLTAYPILDRLAQAGSVERRFFQMRGHQLHNQGRIEELTDLYRNALGRFPDDSQFAAQLANALKQGGNPGEAEEILRASVTANPRGRAAVVALSNLLRQRGALDEAMTLAEDAINLFPVSHRPQRLRALATLCAQAARPDRERRAWERLLRIEPQDADAIEALDRLPG